MNNRSEQVAALIADMDEIDKLAASFQPGAAKNAVDQPSEKVVKLRETYLSWSSRCQQYLNDDGKSEFASEYAGLYKIHGYLSDPAGRTYHTSNRYGSGSSGYRWNHPLYTQFQNHFDQQRLLMMRVRAQFETQERTAPPPPPPPAIDTIRLHSRVRAVSSQLFKDGHYRQAIFNACLALNEAVQQRSGRADLDGNKLMQLIFSKDNPVLRFTGHPDEQQGFMWLFTGMWMAIRNPRAHHLGEAEDLDANEALELLALVSALFRSLDRAVEA